MEFVERAYENVRDEKEAWDLRFRNILKDIRVVPLAVVLVVYTLAFPFLYGTYWILLLGAVAFVFGLPSLLTAPLRFGSIDWIFQVEYPSLRKSAWSGIRAADEAVKFRVRGEPTDHSEELVKANMEAVLATIPSMPPFWYRYNIHVWGWVLCVCWLLLLLGLTLFTCRDKFAWPVM